ncbi:MAG: hypothetical protein HKN47_07495 [Pirellulaceae bacterium]|nr:hypothetical protein [Pirellulaceae bacterium]
MKQRPRLARLNAWLGFGTGAVQGVASVLLMLGGLLIIEPYEIQRASASVNRTARAQMVSGYILKVTEQTRQSALGPLIEQYNPFTQFPQLNKLEQVQQSVQVLSNPGKIEELLHHPSIRQIQSRPEVKNAVNQLMDDPEIQQVLHSGEPMTRESAMQLLSHPAVLELIDQPGFLEEATRVIDESNLLRQVEI